MSKKPTVLMILDGYGLNDRHDGNAVYTLFYQIFAYLSFLFS